MSCTKLIICSAIQTTLKSISYNPNKVKNILRKVNKKNIVPRLVYTISYRLKSTRKAKIMIGKNIAIGYVGLLET